MAINPYIQTETTLEKTLKETDRVLKETATKIAQFKQSQKTDSSQEQVANNDSYKTSDETVRPERQMEEANKQETPKAPTSDKTVAADGMYKVAKGDNIWKILANRGFTAVEIKKLLPEIVKNNPMLKGNPNLIKEGWELKLPTKPEPAKADSTKPEPTKADSAKPEPAKADITKSTEIVKWETYTVKKGDELGKLLIARGYKGADLEPALQQTLAKNPKITNRDLIQEGQSINLPARKENSDTEATDEVAKQPKTPAGTKKKTDKVTANKTSKIPGKNSTSKTKQTRKSKQTKKTDEMDSVFAENLRKNKKAVISWLKGNGFSPADVKLKVLPTTFPQYSDWTNLIQVSIVGGPRKGEKGVFTVSEGKIEKYPEWTK